MERKKILFLDVDGTLVDYAGRIPASAVKAVRLAREKGHKVYICTGRSRAEVYPEIWDIGLDGRIGGNGKYIEDGGQVLLHRCLPLRGCRRVVGVVHGWEMGLFLGCKAGVL